MHPSKSTNALFLDFPLNFNQSEFIPSSIVNPLKIFGEDKRLTNPLFSFDDNSIFGFEDQPFHALDSLAPIPILEPEPIIEPTPVAIQNSDVNHLLEPLSAEAIENIFYQYCIHVLRRFNMAQKLINDNFQDSSSEKLKICCILCIKTSFNTVKKPIKKKSNAMIAIATPYF